MKKLLIILTILSLFGLTAARGFQEFKPRMMHFMGTEIMADDAMPANHCNAKNCVMNTTPAILVASLVLKDFVKEFPTTIFLAVTLISSALFIRRKTHWKSAFIPIEIFSKDHSAVIFRE